MTSQSNPGPVETLRDGFLKVTIWKNHGENGPFLSASIAKTYEKDGELHDGQSFNGLDLLIISELAKEAYVKIRRERAKLPKAEHLEP